MRISRFLALASVVTAFAAPQHASAAPPSPHSCTAKLEAVATPADPGGIVATGVVAVGSAQIICTRDVLTTPPADYVNGWWGHITIYFQTTGGYFPANCGHGPDVINAVGPVLVLAAVQQCVIPVSVAQRTQPLEMVVHWATLDARNYLCCATRVVRATPVGVS